MRYCIILKDGQANVVSAVVKNDANTARDTAANVMECLEAGDSVEIVCLGAGAAGPLIEPLKSSAVFSVNEPIYKLSSADVDAVKRKVTEYHGTART